MDAATRAAGIIDLNVTLHAAGAGDGTERWGVADDDALATDGIEVGLVRHPSSVRVGPAFADAQLREAVSGSAHALLVASTSDTALARLDVEVARLRGLDPAAIWVEPRGDWADGPALIETLAAAVGRLGRPLIAPHRRFGDAVRIGEVTRDAGVPVVVAGLHYMHAADAVVAARRHPHLVFETSQFAGFGLIERLVTEVGAERLAFGSGHPVRPPRAPRFAILGARIDDTAKALILGGTAAALLGLQLDGPVLVGQPPAAWSDTYDVHTHTYPSPWDSPATDAAPLAERLSAFGIRQYNASSVPAIYGEIRGGNEAAVAAARELGRRAYIVINPSDSSGTETELAHWRDADAVCGVKIHCSHSQTPTASAAMAAAAPAIRRFGRPVLIHVQGDGWEQAIGTLAAADEHQQWILAHAGPGAPTRAAGRLAAKHPNVWVELASSMPDDRVLPGLIADAGPKRLLFGSDAPLIDPAFVLGVYDRHVPQEWRTAVATENANALFG